MPSHLQHRIRRCQFNKMQSYLKVTALSSTGILKLEKMQSQLDFEKMQSHPSHGMLRCHSHKMQSQLIMSVLWQAIVLILVKMRRLSSVREEPKRSTTQDAFSGTSHDAKPSSTTERLHVTLIR